MRYKQTCPGYSLLFRDQTEKVIRKAKSRIPKREPKQPQKYDASNELGSISFSPPQSLEFQGFCFFRHNYAALDQGEQGPNFMNRIPLDDQAKLSDVLTEATTSLGMITLSNINVSNEQMAAARRKYLVALRSMKIAVEDPAQARKDDTLLAAMMLGLFEVSHESDLLETCEPTLHQLVANDKLPSSTLWNSHMAGVCGLLGLRSADEFTTETAKKLFWQARYQIASHPTRILSRLYALY